jgi:recombination protein RecT
MNNTKVTLLSKIEEWENPINEKSPPSSNDNFAKQMITAVGIEIAKSKKLAECNLMSIKKCVLQLSVLGLIPSSVTGHAYLIPYKSTCTLIIGYKGLINLMCRERNVLDVEARTICEGDECSVRQGTNPSIEHTYALTGRGKMTHVYAILRYNDGSSRYEIMSKDEIDKIKNQGSANPIWQKHYEAMAKKTVIRRLGAYMSFSSIYQDVERIIASEDEASPENNDIEGEAKIRTEDDLLNKLSSEEGQQEQEQEEEKALSDQDFSSKPPTPFSDPKGSTIIKNSYAQIKESLQQV